MEKSRKKILKRNTNPFGLSKRHQEFIKFVRRECRGAGVKAQLTKGKYILCGALKTSGYFDETVPELKVAMGSPNPITILAHEYCHMRQWLEKEPTYIACHEGWRMDEWLAGKEIKNIEKYVALVRDVELDNEKRTARLVENWKLCRNIGAHIRQANSYIIFHNYLLKTRLWYVPGNTPYNHPAILRLMSDKFDMDYENLDPKIEAAFDKAKIGYPAGS